MGYPPAYPPADAVETVAPTEVVMARQPIFDADLRLAGFELYRAVGDDGPRRATVRPPPCSWARSPTSGSGGSSAPCART
jgi:hypothetical protein